MKATMAYHGKPKRRVLKATSHITLLLLVMIGAWLFSTSQAHQPVDGTVRRGKWTRCSGKPYRPWQPHREQSSESPRIEFAEVSNAQGLPQDTSNDNEDAIRTSDGIGVLQSPIVVEPSDKAASSVADVAFCRTNQLIYVLRADGWLTWMSMNDGETRGSCNTELREATTVLIESSGDTILVGNRRGRVKMCDPDSMRASEPMQIDLKEIGAGLISSYCSFDSKSGRVVFAVGGHCYVSSILNGRTRSFSTPEALTLRFVSNNGKPEHPVLFCDGRPHELNLVLEEPSCTELSEPLTKKELLDYGMSLDGGLLFTLDVDWCLSWSINMHNGTIRLLNPQPSSALTSRQNVRVTIWGYSEYYRCLVASQNGEVYLYPAREMRSHEPPEWQCEECIDVVKPSIDMSLEGSEIVRRSGIPFVYSDRDYIWVVWRDCMSLCWDCRTRRIVWQR